MTGDPAKMNRLARHLMPPEALAQVKRKPCRAFKPSDKDPMTCRWWMTPPEHIETRWEPYCCSATRLETDCPTQGLNPYPQEEDSLE